MSDCLSTCSYSKVVWYSWYQTGIRTALIQPLPDEARNPQRLLFYSSLSGGLSFAVVGAVTRKILKPSQMTIANEASGGRRNVIPGTVMGSILGFSGQGIYNFLDNRHTLAATSPAPTTSLWQKIVSAKWSPITPLSDEQYIEHLNKKLLRIEVEIAVINDEIAELEEQKDLKKDISQLRAEKIDKA